ncbi:MAG: nuclear transport factor 2 family protein [Lentilitoribacter sp.]
MLKKLMAASLLSLTIASPALSDVNENKMIVGKALQELFVDKDVTAVDRYFGPEYVQHNPDVASGTEALKGLVGYLATNENFKVQSFRMFGEGELVATHSIYEGFADVPLVAFDIFRVENGRIVEHWDNMAPVVTETANGNSQVDGATKIADLDKTAGNKALVEEFVDKVLIKGEQVDLTQYVSPETYIQHNPQVANGLDGLGAFLKYLGENQIKFYYTKRHLTVAEGNFVLTASEGVFGDKPQAFYDLFRVENGLIVEHWDVIADMPGADAKHNEDGKF